MIIVIKYDLLINNICFNAISLYFLLNILVDWMTLGGWFAGWVLLGVGVEGGAGLG